jgi:ferredoxin like protein
MKLEDRLFLTRFKVYKENHLKVNTSKCHGCSDKPCTTVCPVKDFKWENDRLVVSYEGCVECGACEIVCPFNMIKVTYPPAGHGVAYRYG